METLLTVLSVVEKGIEDLNVALNKMEDKTPTMVQVKKGIKMEI
ncbi:hypothetical protein RDABS01_009404 [Bienertia sinuspersici]